MENNNSNNGGALITRLIKSLIVIIVMGIFFGLFLYEPRREIKDKNKENNENIIKTDVKILEVVDEEVLELYDRISYAVGYYCGVNIYYTNDKVTAKDIDNKLAFSMALSAMNRDGENSIDNPVNIKADDMEEKIKSILGKDYKYKNLNIKCNNSVNVESVGNASFKSNATGLVEIGNTINTLGAILTELCNDLIALKIKFFQKI